MERTSTPWGVVNDTILVKWGDTHRPMEMVIGEVKPAANAAFIVKAVNNHEALVLALREAMHLIKHHSNGTADMALGTTLTALLED